ncbi:hypothetical protein AX14_010527 [Amanita brunnescens Koide BX004]|nr:hypothetical protein AX14_010527 [Amanita brunnescens Koide BX004]
MLQVGDSLHALRRLDGGLTRLRYLPSNVTAAEDRITWQGIALLRLAPSSMIHPLGVQQPGTRHAINASKRDILPETVPRMPISLPESIMLASASPEYLCCLLLPGNLLLCALIELS